MVRPKAVIRWLPALSFALLLWLCIFASVRAFADPYSPVPPGSTTEPVLEGLGSCPAPPAEAYEGTDDAAGELRFLRSEHAAMCDALAKRTDEVAHRLWWLVSEALQAREQRVLTNTLLSEVRDALVPPIGVDVQAFSASDPVPIEDPGTEESSADVVSAIDASGNAIKEGLWFLIGLMVAVAGTAVYRHVKP